jgi:multiple sugar transport system permease protein
MSRRAKRRLGRALTYLALAGFAIIYIYPFLLAIGSAFKTNSDVAAHPLTPIPEHWVTAAFSELGQQDFPRWLANSVIVAVFVTLGRVLFDSMAGYALARLRFRGRGAVFSAIIAVMAVPGVVLLIPTFLVLKQLNLFNTYPGMILPLITDAAGVFIMRQFFLSVHPSVEEAARIDGAGIFRTYWSVVLPMARPQLMTLTILSFQGSWNNFSTILVAHESPSLDTLTTGVGRLVSGQLGTFTQYPLELAAAMAMTVPVAIVFFVFQRYIMRTGEGAIKELPVALGDDVPDVGAVNGQGTEDDGEDLDRERDVELAVRDCQVVLHDPGCALADHWRQGPPGQVMFRVHFAGGDGVPGLVHRPADEVELDRVAGRSVDPVDHQAGRDPDDRRLPREPCHVGTQPGEQVREVHRIVHRVVREQAVPHVGQRVVDQPDAGQHERERDHHDDQRGQRHVPARGAAVVLAPVGQQGPDEQGAEQCFVHVPEVVPVGRPAAEAEQVVPVILQVEELVVADVPVQLHEQVIERGNDEHAGVGGDEEPDELLEPAQVNMVTIYPDAPRRRQLPGGRCHRPPLALSPSTPYAGP